jgi:hypothetical protein
VSKAGVGTMKTTQWEREEARRRAEERRRAESASNN